MSCVVRKVLFSSSCGLLPSVPGCCTSSRRCFLRQCSGPCVVIVVGAITAIVPSHVCCICIVCLDGIGITVVLR